MQGGQEADCQWTGPSESDILTLHWLKQHISFNSDTISYLVWRFLRRCCCWYLFCFFFVIIIIIIIYYYYYHYYYYYYYYCYHFTLSNKMIRPGIIANVAGYELNFFYCFVFLQVQARPKVGGFYLLTTLIFFFFIYSSMSVSFRKAIILMTAFYYFFFVCFCFFDSEKRFDRCVS